MIEEAVNHLDEVKCEDTWELLLRLPFNVFNNSPFNLLCSRLVDYFNFTYNGTIHWYFWCYLAVDIKILWAKGTNLVYFIMKKFLIDTKKSVLTSDRTLFDKELKEVINPRSWEKSMVIESQEKNRCFTTDHFMLGQVLILVIMINHYYINHHILHRSSFMNFSSNTKALYLPPN